MKCFLSVISSLMDCINCCIYSIYSVHKAPGDPTVKTIALVPGTHLDVILLQQPAFVLQALPQVLFCLKDRFLSNLDPTDY